MLYKFLEGHGADTYDVLSKLFKPLWLFSVIFGAFMAETWEIMAFSIVILFLVMLFYTGTYVMTLFVKAHRVVTDMI